MRAGLGLFAGLVVGYFAILFGWIGYADMFDVHDGDGGKIMGWHSRWRRWVQSCSALSRR